MYCYKDKSFCDRIPTIRDGMSFSVILFGIFMMSKENKSISKRKTAMKESTEKKITTLKVFKVIVIIYSCVIIALLIHTVYGWATGTYDTNYVILASSAATYCSTVAIYEEMKKKEAKKKQE